MLLDSRKENQLPTVYIKIKNYYPKSNFRLKKYTYTDTPLSEVPNLLTRVDPGSSDSYNMLKFKLLPSVLADTHEPHTFILHYCCENDEKIGFYLSISVTVPKRPDNPSLVESFDFKIEMRYINENSGQGMPNNGVKYNSRIFIEDKNNSKHYHAMDYFCREFGGESSSAFTMTAGHTLHSDKSPDSEIDLNIVPIYSQS
jgi:hypothetical protein